MRRLLVASLGVGLCLAAFGVRASGVQDAAARARELADAFSKSKHKVREKHGIRVEKFKDVRSEPAPKADARLYSGEYESGDGYTLSLKVYEDGRAEATGTELAADFSRTRKFTLKDARIKDALLTATKVYEDGSSEPFEGVFINRTDRDSPTDPGTTRFGLGVIFDPPKGVGGLAMGRLFYALKR